MQLIITDSLKELYIRKIITKAKNIVTTFKTSSIASEILKDEVAISAIVEAYSRSSSKMELIFFHPSKNTIGDLLIIAISKPKKRLKFIRIYKNILQYNGIYREEM